MEQTEVRFLNIPENRQACAHRPADLLAARDEWGGPQLWCRCGHVIACPTATLRDDSGKVQTGGALKLWNLIQIDDIARRIAGSRWCSSN
jgi:hypothetical protein